MDIVFKALADPTRRLVLDRLLEKPGLTLSDLVAGTGMRRQSASKHIQILEDAGLVVVERSGREKKHFINVLPIQQISRRWVDKFSKVRGDAILNLKEALEAVGGAKRGDNSQTADPQPADRFALTDEKQASERGPEITSFFTPFEE